jgi:oxygen-independent coproporphyrinogen-3 oxidase
VAPNHPLAADPDAGFGLYVHWPYCDRICPYCDFNVRRTRAIDAAEWRAAFRAEMGHLRSMQGDAAPALTSLYFGGGTPSLMPPALIAGVIDDAAKTWGFIDGAEITVEANPTSSEIARFAAFQGAGVNRLSLGIQSLDDAALNFLGRDHSAAEARDGLGRAAEVFGRTTFDLIYGRPNQTLAAWTDELHTALAFAAGHVSLYQLTIEDGTAFAAAQRRGTLVQPEESALADLYEATQEIMAAAGLSAYEVSNHAGQTEQGRHNLTYWRYGAYAGIGPGAHGRLVIDDRRVATETIRDPEAWRAAALNTGHGISHQTELDAEACSDEMLVTGLRLAEGVPAARFLAVTGFSLAQLHTAPRVGTLREQELISLDEDRLTATTRGRGLLNAVIAEIATDLSWLVDQTTPAPD